MAPSRDRPDPSRGVVSEPTGLSTRDDWIRLPGDACSLRHDVRQRDDREGRELTPVTWPGVQRADVTPL